MSDPARIKVRSCSYPFPKPSNGFPFCSKEKLTVYKAMHHLAAVFSSDLSADSLCLLTLFKQQVCPVCCCQAHQRHPVSWITPALPSTWNTLLPDYLMSHSPAHLLGVFIQPTEAFSDHPFRITMFPILLIPLAGLIIPYSTYCLLKLIFYSSFIFFF